MSEKCGILFKDLYGFLDMRKNLSEETKKLTEPEILEKLRLFTIPDTRGLQQIMIKTSDNKNPFEREIEEEHYDYCRKTPRLVTLSQQDKKRIFSLSVPFSFSDNWLRWMKDPEKGVRFDMENEKDLQAVYNRQMWFSRWEHSSYSPGLNITTKKGLEKIIKILSRKNLPIELESSYHPCFREARWPVIVVPYTWDPGCMDGAELLYLSFMDFDAKLMACTYLTLNETTGIGHEATESNHLSFSYPSYSFHKSTTPYTERKFRSNIIVFSDGICSRPEYHIQEELKRDQEKPETDSGEKADYHDIKKYFHQVIDIKTTLLEISEPVVVFDPKWIKA